MESVRTHMGYSSDSSQPMEFGMESGQRSEKKHSRIGNLLRAMRSPSNVQLTKDEAASTFFRFFRSKHVDDLRFIVKTAFFCFAVFCAVVIIAQASTAAMQAWWPPTASVTAQGTGATETESFKVKLLSEPRRSWDAWLDALKGGLTYIGSALPVFAAIIAWAYLSASARLGIVDLFACEIATLCRVGTLFDVGQRYVAMIKEEPAEPGKTSGTDKIAGTDGTAGAGGTAGADGTAGAGRNAAIDSKENYFPVFSSNSGDLKLLEVLVVTNITAFYTYMKAARDLLAELARGSKSGTGDGDRARKFWNNIVIDLIYVLYLGYERARKAVNDLIEFQPVQDENKIVILITELKCYVFLRKQFVGGGGGVRLARLRLRESTYTREVPVLYSRVMSHQKDDEDWREAMSTVPDLESCYKAAVNEDLQLAAGRVEGEELRARCKSIKSSQELDQWRRRTGQWNDKVVARLETIGVTAIDATADAISQNVQTDFATERETAYTEHNRRLAELRAFLFSMRKGAPTPKTLSWA
jgi:hypothetical protein